MLRLAVILFALVLILAGLVSWMVVGAASFPMVMWGVILLAVMLFERWRYGHTATARGEEWQATDERFIDPETGQLTQVMYNARTGDRSYRAIIDNGEAPPA
jgi:hypothetical protein